MAAAAGSCEELERFKEQLMLHSSYSSTWASLYKMSLDISLWIAATPGRAPRRARLFRLNYQSRNQKHDNFKNRLNSFGVFLWLYLDKTSKMPSPVKGDSRGFSAFQVPGKHWATEGKATFSLLSVSLGRRQQWLNEWFWMSQWPWGPYLAPGWDKFLSFPCCLCLAQWKHSLPGCCWEGQCQFD